MPRIVIPISTVTPAVIALAVIGFFAVASAPSRGETADMRPLTLDDLGDGSPKLLARNLDGTAIYAGFIAYKDRFGRDCREMRVGAEGQAVADMRPDMRFCIDPEDGKWWIDKSWLPDEYQPHVVRHRSRE